VQKLKDGESPKLQGYCIILKDIESFGTGLRRIAETCNTAGVRFEFRKLKSGFVVCFIVQMKKPIKSR
jgi:hypothetical protein